MAKKGNGIAKLLNFVAWLTGIIVSLAVGFAMVDKILVLPDYVGGVTVAVVAGWIVVITTLVSAILAITNYFQ